MPRDNKVQIIIEALDKATSSLKKVEGNIENLTGKSEKLAKTSSLLSKSFIAGIGVGVGIEAFNLLSGAISSAVHSAVSFNAELEKQEMAFANMLNSAEKARNLLKDLTDFAARTPFNLQDLTSATQQLLAFGFSAEKVIPLLRSVGDATAALGGGSEVFNRIIRSLGQMQAKTRVMAEEMMQLTETGLPAWQMLANYLGTDVRTAMEMVSKGMVDAQTMVEAFTQYVSENFAGTMEQQSKTLAGAMTTLNDSIKILLAEGMRPLYDVFRAFIVTLTELTNSPAINGFRQWLYDMSFGFKELVRVSLESLRGLTVVSAWSVGLSKLPSYAIQARGNLKKAFDLMKEDIDLAINEWIGIIDEFEANLDRRTVDTGRKIQTNVVEPVKQATLAFMEYAQATRQALSPEINLRGFSSLSEAFQDVKMSMIEVKGLQEEQSDVLSSFASGLETFTQTWIGRMFEIKATASNVFEEIVADFMNMISRMIAALIAKRIVSTFFGGFLGIPLPGLMSVGEVGPVSTTVPVRPVSPLPLPTPATPQVQVVVHEASPATWIEVIAKSPARYQKRLADLMKLQ